MVLSSTDTDSNIYVTEFVWRHPDKMWECTKPSACKDAYSEEDLGFNLPFFIEVN